VVLWAFPLWVCSGTLPKRDSRGKLLWLGLVRRTNMIELILHRAGGE